MDRYLGTGLVLTTVLTACAPGNGDPSEQFDFKGPTSHPTISPTLVEGTLPSVLHPDETVEQLEVLLFAGFGEEIAQVVTNERGFYLRPGGEVIPSNLFRDREAEQRHLRFGKLSPSLYELQAALDDDELVAVYIFVNGDYSMPELPDSVDSLTASSEEFLELVASQRTLQETEIAAAKSSLLATLGESVVVGEPMEHLPQISAAVPVSLLRSALLNEDTDVIEVVARSEGGVAELQGYAAESSMNVPVLTGGPCGPPPSGPPATSCTGGGLPVGIWESDPELELRSAINTGNLRLSHPADYYLAPATCMLDSECPSTINTSGLTANKRLCTRGVCVEEHLTYTAASMGMLGTFDYGDNGAGGSPDAHPNAPIGVQFGNSGLSDIRYKVGNTNDSPGLNYVLGQSVVYLNRSAGLNNPSARQAADFAGQYSGAFITSAGGNSGAGFTSLCGKFRNGLCVGGYYYNPYNSVSSHHWWSRSNNTNEAGFPERPHLLGPATHNNGIGSSGLAMPTLEANGASTMRYGDYNLVGSPDGQGLAITGTSFAAPAVMSVALLAHQYEGWFSSLYYNQVLKAVILAGTVDSNGDGNIGLSAASWSQSPDASDGAGHVNMAYVKGTLDANQYRFRDLANSDFVSCGASCREYTVVSGQAMLPGQDVKIALAWSACALSQSTDALLVNDLDLVVTRLCDATASTTQSNAITSEVEMVQVGCGSAVATASYSIKIRIKNGATLAACGNRATERVGVAWSVR